MKKTETTRTLADFPTLTAAVRRLEELEAGHARLAAECGALRSMLAEPASTQDMEDEVEAILRGELSADTSARDRLARELSQNQRAMATLEKASENQKSIIAGERAAALATLRLEYKGEYSAPISKALSAARTLHVALENLTATVDRVSSICEGGGPPVPDTQALYAIVNAWAEALAAGDWAKLATDDGGKVRVKLLTSITMPGLNSSREHPDIGSCGDIVELERGHASRMVETGQAVPMPSTRPTPWITENRKPELVR